MKGRYTFTAHIEKDSETGLYIGYIPSLPGAHSQGETLDELHKNLEEVAALCLEELAEIDLDRIQSEFVGTQQVMVNI
ncbi:MAG: type II toxin-antitoxin system HicB family antitoxin [Cytophagales bacterium]|jgi:predicted RNase H-like HicB family nuclease|nr:type II toxin-antitoxin system HicB family antitoxin [Cytophagales bacterium]MCA6367917.1 type II toxin-antitoxin system HicB family antitoxin [Cytophagales bacterium]MCA6370087.1 type II toxin-antitoxin system HicB family antitoxin [Cytophagales bacterium]MCA6374469.1 type II toxin-antitoxin system HicB family antitoxin [Cytophagales bacterium]MCA6383356.1 type II toxin-antitoxin system HicB family antitoxin [Cytophagales bacterium]